MNNNIKFKLTDKGEGVIKSEIESLGFLGLSVDDARRFLFSQDDEGYYNIEAWEFVRSFRNSLSDYAIDISCDRSNNNLKNISTKDLLQELQNREGVASTEIEPEEMFRITTVDFKGNVKHKNGLASPCVILEIFD